MSKFSSLASMCELIVDCPHSTPEWTDHGYIVLRNQNIKGGVLELNSPSYTNELDYKKRIKRATPKTGDIVITREAPMGEVCLIPKGLTCCLGQRQVLLRPKIAVNGKYLFWALQSKYVQNQISWNEGTGSTVSNLRIPVLKDLKIPRHPGSEDKIAEILSSIADKIELNRQTNQTLEQIAQAIFKSWFVDFEPVKAKIIIKEKGGNQQTQELAAQAILSGATTLEKLQSLDANNPLMQEQLQNLINQHLAKQNTSITNWPPEKLAATAALFPNALVDSELGEIPEGWEVQTVGNVLELSYGKALKKSERTEGQYPVYGSGGITGSHNEFLVKGPGIIVGRKGTIGSLYWENSFFFPIDTVFYVECKPGVSLSFLYHLLGTLGLEKMNTDAAVPGLNRNNVYRLEIPTFPVELIKSFSVVTDTLIEAVERNKLENSILISLRDSLLRKLLSGEISTSVAQVESNA